MPPDLRLPDEVLTVGSQLHAAVLGSPIAHSLSPVMHRAAYTALGLDWTYEAVEIQAGGLSAFVGGLDPSWVGLSVTAPLKREAAAYAVTRSAIVEQLGVANTLIGGPDGWHAVNTDVPGAVNALRERGIDSVRSVRFIGGGATVDSLRIAVAELGATDVEVWLRDPAKFSGDGAVVRQLGEPMTGQVDLLISTVPSAAVPADALSSARAVFDVVYNPWPTPLTSAAADAGLPVVTGLDLLAHQAVLQVELMTGEGVDSSLLRDAALAALTS